MAERMFVDRVIIWAARGNTNNLNFIKQTNARAMFGNASFGKAGE